MYGTADLDWVFLDSEHSPLSSDVLQDLIRAYRMTDITSAVRVCDFQHDLAARALDSGALPRLGSNHAGDLTAVAPRAISPVPAVLGASLLVSHPTQPRSTLLPVVGSRPSGALFDPRVVWPPHWHRIQHFSQPGLDFSGSRNVADV